LVEVEVEALILAAQVDGEVLAVVVVVVAKEPLLTGPVVDQH
jgi:hypothetical protein